MSDKSDTPDTGIGSIYNACTFREECRARKRELAAAKEENVATTIDRDNFQSKYWAMRERAEKAEAEREALREALLLVLDQVDYTAGACAFTNMVGACLPSSIIDKAKAAIDAARAKG